jgi:16S rRNA (adenine1518-N6/adenine1519-N6)-dimethyltransferase
MAARPDTADYGPVSLVCQAVATVETLHDLSPNVFWPKPQVHSTLVRIRPDAARVAAVGDLELFHRVTVGLFMHRRKTCLKSLEMAPDLAEFRGRWAQWLDEAGIDHGDRGDTLTLQQVLALAHAAGRQA